MAEKRTSKNLMIILVLSGLMTLYIYIFVEHHLDTPNRVKQDSRTLLSSGPGSAEQR